ncbi:MAG: diacylglycerol kinase family protein [bacterium]
MFAYLSARIRSIGYACKGIITLIHTQPNAQLHAAATAGALIGGYFLKISEGEWLAVILCIGLVWTAEALNTALEFIADEVDPNHRPGIGRAKDVAAAGVLIATLISIATAGVILWNHFFS